MRLETKHGKCHLNVDEVRKQSKVVAKAKKERVLEEDITRL